jgi:hypothetical protein
MGPVSATIAIDAPREQVHSLLADLANRPAFTDHFVDEFRLERLDSAGADAAARFRIPARGLWMETVIAESEPPHRILERGRGGRLDRIPIFTAWELIEGPGPEGCELRVTFVTEPVKPIDRMLDVAARLRGAERWYRRQWARALGRIKALVEDGAGAERVVVGGADRIPGSG